jgi:hypothetical protein
MNENKTYIQLPREYNHCPRCGSDWAEQIFKPTKMNRPLPKKTDDVCLNCGMKYYYGDQDNKLLSLPSFLREGYSLVWHLDEKKCVYGSVEDAVDEKLIPLPWQPFDITPDKLGKLKTYLIYK